MYLYWSIFKKCRQLWFGVFIDVWSKDITHLFQAVISWFPDRKGLVSGLVIAGFGSGALLFAPLMGALTGVFHRVPAYRGEGGLSPLAGEGGRLLIDQQEVVFCRFDILNR
jgi:hypothetical protein